MSDGPAIMMSVPYEQWQALKNRLEMAQEKAACLEKEKIALQTADPETTLLLSIIREALPVIQFAVGNLHYEAIRGWPFEPLRKFGKLLDKMPSLTAFEKELALELQIFAGEAERQEMRRKRELDRIANLSTTPVEKTAAPMVDSGAVNVVTREDLVRGNSPVEDPPLA